MLILAVRYSIHAGVAELVDDVQDVLVSRRTGRPGVTDIQDVLLPRKTGRLGVVDVQEVQVPRRTGCPKAAAPDSKSGVYLLYDFLCAGVAERVDDVQDVLVSRRTGRPGVTDIQDVLMPREAGCR